MEAKNDSITYYYYGCFLEECHLNRMFPATIQAKAVFTFGLRQYIFLCSFDYLSNQNK